MYIHGDDGTKLHKLWINMRYRCNTPTCRFYNLYGGRGIRVHEPWNVYRTFKKWALANGYRDGLTIERKDNDSDYCPENCAFVTIAQNNKNKSNSYWWFVWGKRFASAQDAANFFGVHKTTIHQWCWLRLYRGRSGQQLCYAIQKYKHTKVVRK